MKTKVSIQDKIAHLKAIAVSRFNDLPIVRGMVLHDTLTDTYDFQGKKYTAIEWTEYKKGINFFGMTVHGPDVKRPVRKVKPAVKKPVIKPKELAVKPVKKAEPIAVNEVKEVEPVKEPVMTERVHHGLLSSYGETWGLTADRNWNRQKVLSH